MTTETRKRIRAYKRMLPELRERVIAVALLLAMSASMLGSASFAWITLSRSPEVSGMSTTVAANGNLEIALAQGPTSKTENGSTVKAAAVAPGESQVGDSSAAEGQSIVGANVTWGNLVNVSDPTYGLHKIALRPALLSAYNRTDYPLNGATYGGDGRVVTTNDRYEYASYTLNAASGDYYFAAGDKANYGVRAVSSVAYENVEGNARVDIYRKDTEQLYMDAQSFYKKVVADTPNEVNTLDVASGVTCISALEGLVTVFAQDKLNEMGMGNGQGTRSSCSPYLWYLYQMMLLLEEALELEGKAILELANWQAYIGGGDTPRENTFASIDTLLSYSTVDLQNRFGVKIDTLASYKSSLNTLRNDCIAALYPMAKKCQNPDAPEQQYYWDDIAGIVNKLVNINTTKLNGVELSKLGANDIGSILGSSKNNPHPVVAHGGLLVDLEKRFVAQESRVQADVQVTVRAKVSFISTNVTVYGTVFTKAYTDNYVPDYTKDLSYTEGLKPGAKGDPVAKDTYGLALDLWVRTNYPSAVLTLEGSAKYEDQRATAKIDGTTYELYTITVGSGETQAELDVFKKADAEGTEKWYYVDNPTMEVASEDMGDQTPKEKMIPVIVGYEGENRVWEDWRDLLESGYIEQDATTQGAGSCFVFYADTPTEQAKIMEMLLAFNVAFMDQDGEILGTAKLNLDSAYANQGKVTVPLEVETGTEYTDEAGISHKGITTLTQNTPTMITAVVYLNGSELQNENVLADGELQGQLNIQFGTDSTLIAPDDEELQQQARTITASVSINGQTGTDGYIGGEQGFAYRPNGYPTTVTLKVDGDQPAKIKGFFVRVINATQGTRGEEVEFTPNADGTWTGNFTLTNPGTYTFNTLIVDGVQYTLHDGTQKSGLNEYYPSNRPYIYIQGLKVVSASVGKTPGTHMTADSSISLPVTVGIEASVTPKQVSAQFFSADNTKQFTAILSYDNVNNVWVGDADISASGTYTLKYITVDGTTLDAPATGNYILYLGLTARVSTTVPAAKRTYIYDDTKGVQLPMIVNIFDDGYNPIPNQMGVELYYNNILSPAPMTWNGKQYEGTLDATKAGEMTFQKLIIGNAGTVYNVQNAPVFSAIDTNPVSIVSGKADVAKKTVIGSGATPATMTVVLEHGASADVWARMENDKGADPVYIKGTHTAANPNEIKLEVPMIDGTWTMTRLLLQNCIADNGTWYDRTWTWNGETGTKPTEATESEGRVLILNEEMKKVMSTKIVANYNVVVTMGSIEKTYSSIDNKSAETVAVNLTPDGPGVMLADHSTGDIVVEITDDDGDPIDVVTAGTLEMQHDASTTSKYGYYTGATGSKISFTAAADNGVVTFSGVTLNHAGEYNTNAFNLTIGGSTVEIMVKPKFTISSAKPTVKVTSVTPTETKRYYSVAVPAHTSEIIEGNFSKKIDDHTALAYIYYNYQDGILDQEYYRPVMPEVTLKLEGVSSTYSATMLFKNGTDEAYNKTFEFTNSKPSNPQKIGYGTEGKTSNWGQDVSIPLYPAGKQTVGQITVTYNNVPLTVTLSNPVTINQPQYPLYVDFNSTSTTGEALPTTPARIYSTDGETITLPATQIWETDGELLEGGTWNKVSDVTDYVYRTWSTSGCDSKTYYVGYDRNTVIEESYGTTTTWTNNYTISEWKIGTETYAPGETVEIDAHQTVTAVLSHTKTNVKMVEENLRRTNITYTETMSQTESKDSKYAIDLKTGQTAPTNVVDEITKIE